MERLTEEELEIKVRSKKDLYNLLTIDRKHDHTRNDHSIFFVTSRLKKLVNCKYLNN